jgi:4,5-DOPA dioxygenase extradiol
VLPALFVSHGAPTLILDDVPARHFLATLSKRVNRPKAILAVSAHWGTREHEVNDVAVNATIHDFYGFPDALYRMQYPAPGAPSLARRVAELTGATLDKTRGLDHGAWVPLMLGWPAADIPVAQLSIQPERDAAWHIALGRRLAPLRDEDVLILASGSFTHNLVEFRRFAGQAEPAWVSDFADWMHEALLRRRDDDVANYRRLAPEAERNHPTDEHLLPLFVAYGAGRGAPERLHASQTFGILRMDAYAFP